jgi:hypothetical protein
MMILPRQSDVTHRLWLYKLLSALFDDVVVAKNFRFKGGTCAAMLGYLDRFSIDLDFDYVGDPSDVDDLRQILEKIFKKLGLRIDDNSKKVIQYFLKYDPEKGKRNTISIDSHFPILKSNKYEPKRLTVRLSVRQKRPCSPTNWGRLLIGMRRRRALPEGIFMIFTTSFQRDLTLM